ncbi:MAG: ABC transporter permease [Clostridia bacterium]
MKSFLFVFWRDIRKNIIILLMSIVMIAFTIAFAFNSFLSSGDLPIIKNSITKEMTTASTFITSWETEYKTIDDLMAGLAKEGIFEDKIALEDQRYSPVGKISERNLLMINTFVPKLEKGKWLDGSSDEVVISYELAKKYSIGDVISIPNPRDRSKDYTVVGVLNKNKICLQQDNGGDYSGMVVGGADLFVCNKNLPIAEKDERTNSSGDKEITYSARGIVIDYSIPEDYEVFKSDISIKSIKAEYDQWCSSVKTEIIFYNYRILLFGGILVFSVITYSFVNYRRNINYITNSFVCGRTRKNIIASEFIKMAFILIIGNLIAIPICFGMGSSVIKANIVSSVFKAMACVSLVYILAFLLSSIKSLLFKPLDELRRR